VSGNSARPALELKFPSRAASKCWYRWPVNPCISSYRPRNPSWAAPALSPNFTSTERTTHLHMPLLLSYSGIVTISRRCITSITLLPRAGIHLNSAAVGLAYQFDSVIELLQLFNVNPAELPDLRLLHSTAHLGILSRSFTSRRSEISCLEPSQEFTIPYNTSGRYLGTNATS